MVWPFLRDVLLFAGGFYLLVEEARRAGAERPVLIGAYLAMMGLPLAFRRDERRDK
jgi:hypothetical protein